MEIISQIISQLFRNCPNGQKSKLKDNQILEGLLTVKALSYLKQIN